MIGDHKQNEKIILNLQNFEKLMLRIILFNDIFVKIIENVYKIESRKFVKKTQ